METWRERLRPRVRAENENTVHAAKVVREVLDAYWKELEPAIEAEIQRAKEEERERCKDLIRKAVS